ncbi:MAG: lmo0937 family membrane protein [Gemmatimonadota bacterium]
MLWTLLLILVALWALGLITGNAMGGLVHLLLVVAAIVLVFRLFTGRSVT